MLPHWLAVNESPLAVSMVTGGMSCRDVNSSCLPERWLEAVKLISQICGLFLFDTKVDVCPNIDTLRGLSGGDSCIVASIMILFSCLAICADATGVGGVVWTACCFTTCEGAG